MHKITIPAYFLYHVCVYISNISYYVIYQRLFNMFYVPLHNGYFVPIFVAILNYIYTPIYNMLYMPISEEILYFLDNHFGRNICCKCGERVYADMMYTKVSFMKYQHDECFTYYSRGHHAH